MQGGQKQYGLIKLSKNASVSKPLNKPSIFAESDSDSESESTSIPQFQSSNVRKQAESKISQAIEQDPSIFQYDEVYEEMKSGENKKTKNVIEKKSRYIGNMLKNRVLREQEEELRSERKIQKEREMEGDQFNDKESFVTPAYVEKMEQLKEIGKAFDKQDKIEKHLDVTKQDNIHGIYRYLYKHADDNLSTTENENNEEQSVKFNKKPTNQKKSNLRERNLSEDENEDDENETTDHIETSIDIQVDKSVKTDLEIENKNELKILEKQDLNDQPEALSELKSKKIDEAIESTNSIETEQKEPEKKPKIDRAELIRRMFTKRTVGEAFEEAQKRYLQRKSLQA